MQKTAPEQHGRVCILAVLLLVCGCTQSEFGNEIPNQAPETLLSSAPPHAGITSFSVDISWFGNDSDGQVVGYYFAWEDTTRWQWTTGTGSTFAVTADSCVPSSDDWSHYASFHTFWIKAVDDGGMHDPTPAHRSFTAETVAPQTTITRGPCDRNYCSATGSNILFEWTSFDPDEGTVDSFYYKINPGGIMLAVDSTWSRVGADCTHVVFSGVARMLPETGRHNSFAVVGKDNAGAMEQILVPGQNWCCFDPVLIRSAEITIHGGVLGTRKNRVNGGPYYVGRVAEIFLGVPISFQWEADASEYGARVAGYRYALEDSTVWTRWYSGSTQYPENGGTFLPELGNHVLYVQSIDELGEVSVCLFKFTVEAGPNTGDTYALLLVDDSQASGIPHSFGSWEGHNADETEARFLDHILSGYPFTEWDCLVHELDAPPVSLAGRHRTIIWYVDFYDEEGSCLRELFHRGNRYLDAYVKVGGNVIMIGQVPGLSLDPDCRGRPNYPFLYREEICRPDQNIPISYTAFGIRELFIVGHDAFRGAISAIPGVYPDLPFGDTWPYFTETDTTYLWEVEVLESDNINPYVNARALYMFDYFVPPGLDSTQVMQGDCAALIVDSSGDPDLGSTAYFGWPLIWCDWDSVRVMMRTFLSEVCGEMPASKE
ncbi:MAG: hypothetical protein KAW17_07640 [Candidatus Eisenbacteria sp.]|nr:hypothetical protein [Candidatus Eisenbacteria bacterium]